MKVWLLRFIENDGLEFTGVFDEPSKAIEYANAMAEGHAIDWHEDIYVIDDEPFKPYLEGRTRSGSSVVFYIDVAELNPSLRTNKSYARRG